MRDESSFKERIGTSEDRQRIADQVRGARLDTQNEGFTISRTLAQYEQYLGKLDGLVDYTKQLTSHPTILDIGVGKGIGFKEMAAKWPDVNFQGTSLAVLKGDHVTDELRSRVTLTSAEVLRGFETSSVAGVIGCFSITYGDPKATMRRINEVLMSGGVMKTIFESVEEGLPMKGAGKFIRELLDFGYKVAADPNQMVGDTIVAVKPGGTINPNMEELFSKTGVTEDYLNMINVRRRYRI